jgi:hypothetical protein
MAEKNVNLIKSEDDDMSSSLQKPTGTTSASPVKTFSGTAPATPSATQQTRATQAAGPIRGTGFTGVSKFLQANVGSRLGQQVSGRVQQAGQEAQSRLAQAKTGFETGLTQAQQERQQQTTAATAALEKLRAGEAAISPEQQAAYQAAVSGTIQAPKALQDIGAVQTQANLAAKLAQGTQTAAGRMGLLQQTVGRGPRQYTTGQSALDALILGQSAGELAKARQGIASLGRQVESEKLVAEEQAKLAQSKARQAAEQLKTETGKTRESITSSMEESLAKAQEQERQRSEQQTEIERRLAQEDKTSGAFDALSYASEKGILSPEKIDEISSLIQRGKTVGLSPEEIVKQSIESEKAKGLTRFGAASEADIARMRSLAALEGTQFQSDLERYKAGALGFDPSRIKGKISELEKLKGLSVPEEGPGVLQQAFSPEQIVGQVGEDVSRTFASGTSAGARAGALARLGANLGIAPARMATGIAGEAVGSVLPGVSQSAEALLGADRSVGERAGGALRLATLPVSAPITAAAGAARSIGRGLRRLFSDENLKTNVEYGSKDIRNMLDKLEPCTYDYKDKAIDNRKSTSVMAQDLEKSKIGKTFVDDTKKGKMIDYSKMLGTVLAAQADLHKRLKKIEK